MLRSSKIAAKWHSTPLQHSGSMETELRQSSSSSGEHLQMSRHFLAPTQSLHTIVPAKRRNLVRVSTALGQILPIAPRWHPGKGIQGMVPFLPGQFYQSKPRAALAWWTAPSTNCPKPILRIIQDGVKVEFIDKESFHPLKKAPLLQGRKTGAYGDLAPGGQEFLSRSRVQTPKNGKQRLVHTLIPLNDATVKRRARYEDPR